MLMWFLDVWGVFLLFWTYIVVHSSIIICSNIFTTFNVVIMHPLFCNTGYDSSFILR